MVSRGKSKECGVDDASSREEISILRGDAEESVAQEDWLCTLRGKTKTESRCE